MNGKELIISAMSLKPTPRVPWVPFVGSHGGSLVGATADKYLTSSELMTKGILSAVERYQADGIPIVFDLQLEAEILGCELHWAENGPPSVKSHPLEDGVSLADLPEFELDAGRLPLIWETLHNVKAKVGDEVALYGLICGPFTLALHLLGNDIFTEMYDHSDYVQAVMGLTAAIGRKMAVEYINRGADIIAITDPMVSQISPDHYAQFVRPHMDAISRDVTFAGGMSSIFVCGDATRNLEMMSTCLAEGCSIDENIDLSLARDIMSKAGKSLGGNMRLTTVLLLGDPNDARMEAAECLRKGEAAGYILAPGCDLPFATPPENLEAVAQVVRDPYQRQVAEQLLAAKTTAGGSAETSGIELPDYPTVREVYIDLVTLDSETCAPCQYMKEAATRATAAAGVPFNLAEYKITGKDGLAMMGRLGATNIPTICIDGKVAFSSIIPDQATLIQAIQDAAGAKK